MLYAYGGDKIRLACDSHAEYATLTYALTIAHLKEHFKQETTKLDALMFVGSKPKPDEKLADYAARLKQYYKATGLPEDKCDFMVLIVIVLYAPNSEIRNKGMETATTLTTLLEWQAMNEITEKLDESELLTSDVVIRRVRDPKPKNQKQTTNRKKRSESEKKRYNDKKQRLEGCYFCGEKFPHSGKCPADGQTCNFCNQKNHIEEACLLKKREKASKPNNNKSAFYLEEGSNSNSDYSFRVGKLKDDCPRAIVNVDGMEVNHVLDTGANINILTRKTYESLINKPKLIKYKRHLYAYHTKQEVQVLGKFTTTATANKISIETQYIVLKNDDVQSENLLGFNSALAAMASSQEGNESCSLRVFKKQLFLLRMQGIQASIR